MPFTGSHPAAILPFLRTPLPASALVIGSMAPDFPFFVPVAPGLTTHTAVAIGTTDVALGALGWLLWHGLLAAPALDTAPHGLRARLGTVPLGVRVRLRDARAALLVVVALALGSGTHVLWDEFTHARRWGPEHVPALAENWGLLPDYRWLQYVSSLVGALVLLVWLARWWRRTPTTSRPAGRVQWWPWALLVAVGIGVGGPVALTSPSFGAAGFDGTAWGGGAALAVAVVLAAGWHVARRAGSSRSMPTVR
ncbi:MAG TPA: DUF4184 family protein [Nocardioides sp.]|nr:DUF4184 family protein [Nocardioides sp.]